MQQNELRIRPLIPSPLSPTWRRGGVPVRERGLSQIVAEKMNTLICPSVAVTFSLTFEQTICFMTWKKGKLNSYCEQPNTSLNPYHWEQALWVSQSLYLNIVLEKTQSGTLKLSRPVLILFIFSDHSLKTQGHTSRQPTDNLNEAAVG